ncbi:hypothetical protein [Flavobacterium gilvum]|uniref:Uncharacterized protein n=1 Tax=Flavobacterium gilvum TaxID=1492737 RepID=A0AAC9I638_9FLAO|nr:hypothetical protein [Flavobacterium gilvum]AOW08582.1 hypothetical protein EM308_03210 [Flavobacterium gilvum]KFC58424.1 hypothetical protein FEM08_27930 [Flavobacterium gilvum]
MEAKTPNTENNINMFAFMPEMVLEHLNHAKPTEFIIEEPTIEPIVHKVNISADPEIPELDSFFDTYSGKNNKIY